MALVGLKLAVNLVVFIAVVTTAFGKSVLHPNLKYYSVDTHPENGQPIIDVWSPSKEQLSSSEKEHLIFHPVANQESFTPGESGTEDLVNDYVDTDVTLTYSNNVESLESQDYTVEVVLVCDKEWGDKFKHNREAILKYWTTYYWDLNMRFKTLPKSNISLILTSIIVMKNANEQPFIEDARDDAGNVSIFSALGNFAAWIWNQTDTLPKFDMAILVSKDKIVGAEGVAYVKGACRKHTGSLVYRDYGSYSSVYVGAHEIAHNLGAPHDHAENYPGGCNSTGYIMAGQHGRFHFSECSDRTISDYVRSDQAACLKRIDEPTGPVIQPDYSSVPTPTMDEQCKLGRGENATKGYADCTRGLCWVGPIGYGLAVMDNTPCFENGHCFRGLCFPTTLSFITNLVSKNCLLGTDRFSGTDKATVSKCPVIASPLDQFRTIRVNSGYWLSVRYSPEGNTDDRSKCLIAPDKEGGLVEFGPCFNAGRSMWDLVSVYFGEYLLIETSTGRCAKQEGSSVIAVNCGNRQDRSMMWKIDTIME